MAATIHEVRRLVMALPGVHEGVCYGTPAFYVRGKLLARQRDDLETLVVKVPREKRAALIEERPDAFFVTSHYFKYHNVLVNLPNIGLDVLSVVLTGAWRRLASRRQSAQWDASPGR